MLTATYLINRLPSRVLGGKSPLEVLKERNIDISHLKVFGCVCFVHIQANKRGKLDPRAEKCVFLGYSSTQKGYKCYSLSSRKIIVSRDVRFDENTLFFTRKSDGYNQGESLFDLFPTPNLPADEDSRQPFHPTTPVPASSFSHPAVSDSSQSFHPTAPVSKVQAVPLDPDVNHSELHVQPLV